MKDVGLIRARLGRFVLGDSPYQAFRGEPPAGTPTLKGDIGALLELTAPPTADTQITVGVRTEDGLADLGGLVLYIEEGETVKHGDWLGVTPNGKVKSLPSREGAIARVPHDAIFHDNGTVEFKRGFIR